MPASEAGRLAWAFVRTDGLRLGTAVRSIRSFQYHVEDDPERRQWLDDMGFVWGDDLERQWEVVKEEAATN